MKVLGRIGISVLIILFSAVGVCFSQNTAQQAYDKGVEYAAEGKFKEAREEFQKALMVDPFYISAKSSLNIIEDADKQKIESKTAIHIFKCRSHYNKGQLDEAIAECNKAIEINPKCPEAYNERGIAYAEGKGQYDKAISDFYNAIEINPRYAMAYNNRAIAYDKKGQYDKAISDFNKAIEINPGYAMAYNNRGYAFYKNKRQYDKAISDYTRAIEINPRFVLAYNNRGYAYHTKGNMKKACSDWKRACELGDCHHYMIAKSKGDCE